MSEEEWGSPLVTNIINELVMQWGSTTMGEPRLILFSWESRFTLIHHFLIANVKRLADSL